MCHNGIYCYILVLMHVNLKGEKQKLVLEGRTCTCINRYHESIPGNIGFSIKVHTKNNRMLIKESGFVLAN